MPFLTSAFVVALLLSLALKYWLATRQLRHVAAHRAEVPPAFAGTVSLASHQRAADYTLAKGRFGLLTTAFGSALLIGWTLMGGLDSLNVYLRDAVLSRWSGSGGEMAYQLALLAAFSVIGSVLELPFDAWSTFRIEQRFGFNRTTVALWLADLVKSTLVGALVALPLAALVLWIMRVSGGNWWLWAWLAWTGFSLAMMVIYPTLIAPIFNKFTPLADQTLRERVEALMARCGFTASGLFVMDGSRRSAHANAYFTGLGSAKRVVFFDTLLAKLNHGQVEAVLAHELGHFHHKHVIQRMLMIFGLSFASLALLGWLAGQPGFYTALGVQPNISAPNDAMALLLFMLAVPVFGWFVSPLMASISRRQEYQADAYAARSANANDLAGALLSLIEDNASTLTPDPLFVRFYYSHPPAAQRLAALRRVAT
jgi:STE24 endopeptidase